MMTVMMMMMMITAITLNMAKSPKVCKHWSPCQYNVGSTIQSRTCVDCHRRSKQKLTASNCTAAVCLPWQPLYARHGTTFLLGSVLHKCTGINEILNPVKTSNIAVYARIRPILFYYTFGILFSINYNHYYN